MTELVQGQGGNTARKEEGFRELFRMRLRVSRPAAPHPYWHADLNAGCGWNDEADCPGSPLVFLQEVLGDGRDFRVMFCDHNPDACDGLRDLATHFLEGTGRDVPEVACEDNGEALRRFSARIAAEELRPGYAVGTVVCDPNGLKAVPFDSLAWFFARHPRIDFLLNVNLSLVAMCRGCAASPTTKQNRAVAAKYPDLWPDLFGLRHLKAHWIVRNPSPGGEGNRFTLLFGSNHPAGMNGFTDWFPAGSWKGERILRHLERVNPDQPGLFGD